MRLLHTSDWHLGKLFHEHSLMEDQKFILDQIIQILKSAKSENNPYHALLVSGDIYDRAVPSAEAVKLLNSFLVELNSVLPELHIFLISGNHDGANRLSYAAEFLEMHNIHLVTDTKNFSQPFVLEAGEEKLAVYQLPYLMPLSLEGDDEMPLRNQQSLYEKACKEILSNHKKNYEGIPSVLNAHLLTLGSTLGGSERSSVGTLEQVDVSLFEDFTYCAFGHIHRTQACDSKKHCYYSGAILAYNFDDSKETFVLDVQIDEKAKATVEKIPLKPLHEIARLEGRMTDFVGSSADKALVKKHKDCYVQVVLTDEVMPNDAFNTLKLSFPNILSVVPKQRNWNAKDVGMEKRQNAMESKNPETIFESFLGDLYGDADRDEELVQSEKELYLKLVKELEGAE